MSRGPLRYVVVTVLILVLVTAGTALAAAPGSPFRLGVLNTVQKVTRLVGGVASSMLRIVNTGTGAALELRVNAGAPPMIVNSTTKVDNLNADSLDGLNQSAFLRSDGQAVDADRLDGLDSSTFMGADVRTRESAQSTGTDAGGGTRYNDMSCNAGEVLISGGPANVDNGSILLESFPFGATTWRARIDNNDTLDSFSVVVLCARF
jgi:hypothetical protein